MESNKDEALKCLSIAQRHLNAGNHSSARRFCEKSISLFPTLEASELLQRVARFEQDATQDASSSSSHTSSADPHVSGAKHRQSKMQNGSASDAASSSEKEKRDYTHEQAEIVRRIQVCKVTDYYEILSLKKECAEADIKRAYRKLALQLHPDKNGAPGADEAFKMVSKAFQILSDPEKRSAFDRFGADPDSRFAGMRPPNSDSAAFAHPFAGATFEGELSPEDLFNMFFGGGVTGNGFGGPVFTASFGPGGFRTTRVHLGRRRAAHQQADSATSPRTAFAQLAPLIILFIFTLFSAVPGIFSSPRTPNPLFSFTPSNGFSAERETSGLNVKYYVNPAEFSVHPISKELAGMLEKDGRQSSLLEKFERYVENSYKEQIYILCERDQERKQRRKEQKMGFLGIGTDWEAIKAINEEKIPTCEEYSRLVGR